MDDFNDAMGKIDAAVAANDAAAATVTAQISALQSAMPRIVTGSWTGDGVNGRALTFPFAPKLLVLFLEYDTGRTPMIVLATQSEIRYLKSEQVGRTSNLSFSGNQFVFDASFMGNTSGCSGSYIAFA